MAGWIKLYRRIQDQPEWHSEPFTKQQAWIDMLLLAAHKPCEVTIRGVAIPLEPGQLALSEVEAAKRWRWSRNKVRMFNNKISEAKTEQQKEPQIKQQKNNVTSIITILKWSLYQGNDTAEDTAEKTPSDTAEGQQKDTYKNVKNVKKVKKEDIVLPDWLTNLPGFTTELWGEWMATRKRKRASNSPLAVGLLIGKLNQRQSQSVEAIQTAIEAGWTGFEWAWFDNRKGKGAAPAVKDTAYTLELKRRGEETARRLREAEAESERPPTEEEAKEMVKAKEQIHRLIKGIGSMDPKESAK